MLNQTTLLYVLLFSLALISSGGLRNVTVDDEFGDELTGAVPEYLPANGWTQGSVCTGCAVKPDPSDAFNGTWHDTTLDLGQAGQKTFNVNFTGTAVYTFFIIPDNVTTPGVTILANMTVTLDGEQAAIFVHVPDNTTDFIYNVPGYVNENLANSSHQLSISANAQVSSSLILFDYLIYTTMDTELAPLPVPPTSTNNLSSTSLSPSVTPSSHKSPQLLGPVLGGVLGGVVLGVLLAFLCIYLRRRQLLNAQDLRSLEAHPVSFVYTSNDPYSPQPSNMDSSAYNSSSRSLSFMRRGAREGRRAMRDNNGAEMNERVERRENRRDRRESTRTGERVDRTGVRDKRRRAKQKDKRTRTTTHGITDTTSTNVESIPRRPLPEINPAMLPSRGKSREREVQRPAAPQSPPSYSEAC